MSSDPRTRARALQHCLEPALKQALYAPKETNPGGWPQRMGIQKMQEATSQNRANDAADIAKAGKFL